MNSQVPVRSRGWPRFLPHEWALENVLILYCQEDKKIQIWVTVGLKECKEYAGVMRRHKIRILPSSSPCLLIQNRVEHGMIYQTTALEELGFQVVPRTSAGGNRRQYCEIHSRLRHKFWFLIDIG